MFFRFKKSGERSYVQIVENKRIDGAVRQSVICGRPQWQALFALNDLVSCGHMSGLSVRSICPRALMKMVWGEQRRCGTFGAV